MISASTCAPLRLVVDDPGPSRQVRRDRPLQVEREARVGLEVREPGALLRPRHAADVDPPAEVVEDDLDPSRLTGPAPVVVMSMRSRRAASARAIRSSMVSSIGASCCLIAHAIVAEATISHRTAAASVDSSPMSLALRTVTATRYVTPLREGGSLPALVEADDDGLYVVKFRAPGRARRRSSPSWSRARSAAASACSCPRSSSSSSIRCSRKAEPDQEIQDLIARSAGLNLGLDFLPGALAVRRRPLGPRPTPEQAADIVWFDALVTNVDRTAKNINMLTWHGRTWLIDHGAALYIHHTWRNPARACARGRSPR